MTISLAPNEAATFASNPFAERSKLPFGAPPLDRIRDEHFAPAIEEGMRRQLREVDAITEREDAPTFANTIVALEQSGELLTRVLKTFGAVTSANTNDTLQQIQTDQAPKLAAHSDAILLNETLFRRVRAIYERREELALTPEQHHLVERYHLEFIRAGAQLPEEDKARLRALNREESTLTTEFQNRLLAATKAGALVVESRGELD